MLSRRQALAAILAGAAATAAGVTAWSGPGQTPSGQPSPPGASASPGQALTLYAPREAELVRRLGAAFARTTSLSADIPPLGGPGAVYQAVRGDLEAGTPVADVVAEGGPYAFLLLERHGLLSGGGEGREGAGDRHAPSHWHPVAPVAFTLVGRGMPRPSAFDLTALPERDVPLILPDPGQWDYGTMLVLAVLDWFRQTEGDFERGWQFLERVLARPFRQARSLDQLRAWLGEPPPSLALLPDQLAGALLPGLADAWRLWPEQVLLLPSFAAEVSDAPHPEIARRFLSWLASEEAHLAMAEAGGLPPPCEHTNPACRDARLLAARATPLDIAWGFGKYNEVRREWQRRFWKD